ncbi:MAG: AmmeMemoRadiSam system protein B [Deltaproteobacteria bacterium]|nr:AmmeMemoRadiSam system protein B [Deltaproteobacteria bacterium]
MIRIVITCAALAALSCSEPKPSPPAAGDTAAKGDDSRSETMKTTADKKDPKRVAGAFPSQVAGGFYPGDPDTLRKAVRGFLDAAGTAGAEKDRDIVGILTPHAGYPYSGPVAGESFRAVMGRGYKTVVVMALSHHRRAEKAAVLDRPAYDTPLGSVPIDRDAVKRLVSEHGDVFMADERVFTGEHSLEVEHPFVQVALPGVDIVPIIVAVADEGMTAAIGRALFDAFGRRADVLFVVSSDMSHYNPYEEANRLDNHNLGLLEKWKIDEWTVSASDGARGMCGFLPLLSFVRMFEGYDAAKRKVTRLAYKNSGDTAGGRSEGVVGYGSLAFSVERGVRTERATEKPKVAVSDFGPFTAQDRKSLMELAKRVVAAAARGERYTPEAPAGKVLTDLGAAFVTLKKNGDLRGCIGHVIARVPLYKCIADVAEAAAIHDSRFNPVTPDELKELTYEISVLTPPEPITPDKVVVGRDGLIMSRGYNSGLLLPQVPGEWGWGREEFLMHTCRKAGMEPTCWKDPATDIKAFRAIVWGEQDLGE